MSDQKWYERRPSPDELRERRRWAIPLILAGLALIAISIFIVFA